MKKLLITGGRVLDPKSNRDGIFDILVEEGKIKAIEENIALEDVPRIEAQALWVMPGLIDMHVHLREPGFEHKETIKSGTKSAAAGGFTTIACMPNTQPVVDQASLVEYIQIKAQREGFVKVRPIGAISKGLQGEELAPMGEMMDAGAVAFSDDGNPVVSSSLMKKALEYASMWKAVIISHCEEPSLSKGGLMNEGEMSTILGMQGIPSAAEEIMVARDIALARYTGCRVHIAHVSTAAGVELIRRAKRQGVAITAEATPHHFSLTDRAVEGYDADTKVNPPLRTQEDVEAVLKGLQDGTIDVIATDHAPHHRDEKKQEYKLAPFGIVGLETALPLAITHLIRKNILSPLQLVEKMSLHPARILNLSAGTLQVGQEADITIIDPQAEKKIDKNQLYSQGRNTPFHGQSLYGQVLYTIVDGIVVKNLEWIEKGE
ncbi:dihydroorotase [Irregularibacter muris]|uniref:Dihydroorotase n=1 Tax=Irregularibacter muris TaxID=1796619 RepID=A0AAE3KZU0_9FIRM|nr:dihydroorotase [Irregularibacter muris]MCR1899730.1 dihydroorotase [Irregularibacter muris]